MVVVNFTRLEQAATFDDHFIVQAKIDDGAKTMLVNKQLYVAFCQELQSVASEELALSYLPAFTGR
jgi:hypothetical protein